MTEIGELNNLKKLDSVLEYLFKYSLDKQTDYKDLSDAVQRGEIKADRVDIQYILDKLLKDEKIIEDKRYVDQFDNGIIYRINFEGRVFVEQKGYEQKFKDDDAENIRLAGIETRQRFHQNALTVLTAFLCVASLVAAWYYLDLLATKYHWFSSCKYHCY